MNNSRYNEPLLKLELDKKRFRVKYCPCGKNNKDGKFVPYVGHENKGYCHSCGETFLPELPEVEQWNTPQPKPYKPRPVTPQPKPVSLIPVDLFKASLNEYGKNHFVKFLIDLFGARVASELVSRYFIGTSKHWNGATVFWQIDTRGKVRTGKIMLYSLITGKRVKEPFNHISWAHTATKQPVFDLVQCMFGEHLLIDKTKPVAIVESEKTAVIASVYLPQFIWVAVGSITNLNADKCHVLKGRTVTLFPDLNGFDKWNSKAKELSHLATFTVSDLLERKATEAERKQGLDLADYLIKFNYKEFATPKPLPAVELFKAALYKEAMETGNGNADKWFEMYHKQGLVATDALAAVYQLSLEHGFEIEDEPAPATIPKPEQTKREGWENDITELEKFFKGITLPARPVRLNPYITISNISIFIESHLVTVKANNGNGTFLPHLDRLLELKQFLTSNQN